MFPFTPPVWLIQGVGIVQIVLALGSLAIPVVLGWRQDTLRLPPLTRQIFWVYAGYIFVSHLLFGFISVMMPAALIDGSALAVAVTGFIALWWIARLSIQFAVLDRSAVPSGAFFVFAEVVLVMIFVACSLTYGLAAWSNLRGLEA